MDSIQNPTNFEWVAIALVVFLAGARLARLVVHDHYPPVEWAREQWDHYTGASGWNLLLHCHYCFSMWSTLGVLLWGFFADWNTAWWLVNGSLAAAYLAAAFVSYDGDD